MSAWFLDANASAPLTTVSEIARSGSTLVLWMFNLLTADGSHERFL